MNEIVLYVGLGVFIIGGIGFLLAAFRTSILWGLAVLFITPVAIIYLIVHWQDAKGPFKLQVIGLLIIGLFVYMDGGALSVESISSKFSNEIVTAPVNSGFSRSDVTNQQFRCDGRTHCSQMNSCAEATYFLKNCPNTKMDGNNDGVPCERQWCK
ncbi:MAG: excalibur calcium-binding domain-containing protein [Pseudomonas sp.]|nr:excalibur calcium-binding domain-containing protein [Pseudomonas sp.]